MNAKFLSDEEIEAQYLDICDKETIFDFDFKESGDSGWINIKLPQNEYKNNEISKRKDYNDDDLLDEEKTEHFIIYDNGQIAFESWYPPKVSEHLIKKLISEFQDSPKSKAQQKALRRYASFLR